MGGSNSKTPAQGAGQQGLNVFKPEIEVVQKIDEPHYGEIKIVREIKTGRRMILKELNFSAQTTFDKEIQYFVQRAAAKHPNMVQVLGYNVVESSHFCTHTYHINLFIELLDRTLLTEIENRAGNKKPYTENELMVLAEDLINAGAFLQSHGFSHSDIRPFNVFASNNVYKLSDPSLYGTAGTNGLQQTVLKKSNALLSPQLLAQVPRKQMDYKGDQNRADVYSLGITLLSAATLTNGQDLYNYQTGTINTPLVQSRLEQVHKSYGPFVYDNIKAMLNDVEPSRPDMQQLAAKIAPLHNQIRNPADHSRLQGAVNTPTINTTPIVNTNPIISTPIINTTPVVHTTTPVITTTPVVNNANPTWFQTHSPFTQSNINDLYSRIQHPQPVVSTTTPIVNTTPVVHTTTPIVNTTTPVVNTTPSYVQTHNPFTTQNINNVYSQIHPTTINTTPVITNTTPVVHNTTPIVNTTTPSYVQTNNPITTSNINNLYSQIHPTTTNTTPVITNTTPSYFSQHPFTHDNINSVYQNIPHTTTPIVNTTTPVVHTTTPTINTTTPVIHSTTPSIHSYQPTVHHTNPIISNTTPYHTSTYPTTTYPTTTYPSTYGGNLFSDLSNFGKPYTVPSYDYSPHHYGQLKAGFPTTTTPLSVSTDASPLRASTTVLPTTTYPGTTTSGNYISSPVRDSVVGTSYPTTTYPTTSYPTTTYPTTSYPTTTYPTTSYPTTTSSYPTTTSSYPATTGTYTTPGNQLLSSSNVYSPTSSGYTTVNPNNYSSFGNPSVYGTTSTPGTYTL